jgi:electron transfer flavoprotein alpha subunit
MPPNTNVLIVVETLQGKLPPPAYELMGVATRIAQGGTVCAALFGDGAAPAAELFARGIERVFALAPAGCPETVEERLPLLMEVCRRSQPGLVLLTHSVTAAETAPRLAFRLDAAVATGCVDVALDEGNIRCTRACYGGVAREVDIYESAPVIATVRAGAFEPARPAAATQGELITVQLASVPVTRTRVVERNLDSAEGARLEDARVIVAGGRGLEGPDGFRVLETLARELGGAVGASRVPCDLGWCPHSWQIGLTGKTVTPELYIAVGISGAGHHMAGCGNAKTIVAINTDPEAAIFKDAQVGVLGDYREVVPALAAELRLLNQKT